MPALPSGALPGAAGFIKADTTLTVELTNATGCPCRFRAALFLTGVAYLTPFYTDVTLTTVGERTHLAMTGAQQITTAGAKTVEIRIFRAVGSGTANVYGNATATYFPFGSAGGNLLSDPAPTSIGPNATG